MSNSTSTYVDSTGLSNQADIFNSDASPQPPTSAYYAPVESDITLFTAPDYYAPVAPAYIPPQDMPLYEAPDYFAPVVPDLGGNETGDYGSFADI